MPCSAAQATGICEDTTSYAWIKNIAESSPECEHQPTWRGERAAMERGWPMELEFLRKARDSGTGNCPALYRADNGNYVVQGRRLDAATRAKLRELADDETAVEVPADVIAGIVAESG